MLCNAVHMPGFWTADGWRLRNIAQVHMQPCGHAKQQQTNLTRLCHRPLCPGLQWADTCPAAQTGCQTPAAMQAVLTLTHTALAGSSRQQSWGALGRCPNVLKQSRRCARCALTALAMSAATLNCTMSGVVSAWHAGQDQLHHALSSVGLSSAAALPEGGRNEAEQPGSLRPTNVSLLLPHCGEPIACIHNRLVRPIRMVNKQLCLLFSSCFSGVQRQTGTGPDRASSRAAHGRKPPACCRVAGSTCMKIQLSTDGKSIGMLALLLIFLVVRQVRLPYEARFDMTTTGSPI